MTHYRAEEIGRKTKKVIDDIQPPALVSTPAGGWDGRWRKQRVLRGPVRGFSGKLHSLPCFQLSCSQTVLFFFFFFSSP